MNFQQISNSEIDEGAVLVIAGEYKGRVGFYCLQNEQTYDMREIERCVDCQLTEGKLNSAITHDSESVTLFDSPVEIETGIYCMNHRRALVEHDMAVIYWDRPYGDKYSLVHLSELVKIPSSEYASYERECKNSVEEALGRLLRAVEK